MMHALLCMYEARSVNNVKHAQTPDHRSVIIRLMPAESVEDQSTIGKL